MKKAIEKRSCFITSRSIVVCILLLALVESICGICSYGVQRYIKAENAKQMEATVECGAKSYEQCLSKYMDMVEAMCYCIPDNEHVLNIENVEIINMASKMAYVHSSYVVDTSGMAVNNHGVTIDMRENSFVKSILKCGREGCSELTYGIDGDKAVVFVGQPIYDKNKRLTGVGMVAVRSASFSDNIAEIMSMGKSICMMIDDKTNVADVYNGKVSYLSKVENFLEYFKDGEYTVKNGYTRLSNDIITKRTNQCEVQKNGMQYYVSYSPIRAIDGYIVVISKAEEVYEVVNTVKKHMKHIMIGILVCFVVYIAVLVMMNISVEKGVRRKRKELEEKAEIDGLTTLYNKLATERYIREYLENEGKDTRSVLFIVDIDNFKSINDTKGHAFGDVVISSIGRGLGIEFRTTDIIGRIGGDEFLVFLKNIANHETEVREAEKLIKFFRELKPGEYVKTEVTASIGGAVYPEDATDFEALYRAADSAAYRTKKGGKNGYSFWCEEGKQSNGPNS